MSICNKYLEIAKQRYEDVSNGNSESKFSTSKLKEIVESFEDTVIAFEEEEEVLALVPDNYEIIEIVGVDMNNDVLDLSVLA